MNPFAALCDDFGVFAYLNTKLDLPTASETVLHFFEAIQKSFPEMTGFERREDGEFVLEEEQEERQPAFGDTRAAAAGQRAHEPAFIGGFRPAARTRSRSGAVSSRSVVTQLRFARRRVHLRLPL